VKQFKTVLDAVGFVFEHGLHKPDQSGQQPDLVFERSEDGVKITFKPEEGKNERDYG
jgi:hypothetical protein